MFISVVLPYSGCITLGCVTETVLSVYHNGSNPMKSLSNLVRSKIEFRFPKYVIRRKESVQYIAYYLLSYCLVQKIDEYTRQLLDIPFLVLLYLSPGNTGCHGIPIQPKVYHNGVLQISMFEAGY